MIWPAANFLIARTTGVAAVAGYVHRGLGLHVEKPASPRKKTATQWSLAHLGTGHQICWLNGHVANVFPIATAIAECGDWEWDGFEGYKNRDPGLLTRALAIIARHKEAGRGGNNLLHNEEIARQIAISRAA